MADISHSLFIKYGLSKSPTQQEVDLWASTTQILISAGFGGEEAGRRAAQQIFSDFETRVYCSQADTIMALLAAAKKK